MKHPVHMYGGFVPSILERGMTKMNARWFPAGNKEDIYSLGGIMLLQEQVSFWLSRWSSKLSNFSVKSAQRCAGRAASDTCVADSSRFIEHIINPLQHRIKVVRRLKTEDSLMRFQESLCMKAGSIEASDQC
jgi:hypothetical protein